MVSITLEISDFTHLNEINRNIFFCCRFKTLRLYEYRGIILHSILYQFCEISRKIDPPLSLSLSLFLSLPPPPSSLSDLVIQIGLRAAAFFSIGVMRHFPFTVHESWDNNIPPFWSSRRLGNGEKLNCSQPARPSTWPFPIFPPFPVGALGTIIKSKIQSHNERQFTRRSATLQFLTHCSPYLA